MEHPTHIRRGTLLQRAILIAGGGIVFLLVMTAALLLGVDTQFVKDRLNQAVLDSKQRVLTIDGTISVSLALPDVLVIRLGHATLSERHGTQTFASFDAAQAALHLWPLLTGHIVIDGVETDGLKLRLVRQRDGTWNFADLLSTRDPAHPAPQFRIDRVDIRQGGLLWRDEREARDVAFEALQITAGPLGNAAEGKLNVSAQLRVGSAQGAGGALRLALQTAYRYDAQRSHYALSQLAMRADSPELGRLRDVVGRFEAAQLAGDGEGLKADKLVLQLTARSGATDVALRLSSALVAAWPLQMLELPDLAMHIAIAPPQVPSLPPLELTGPLRLDLAQQAATARLTGRFADSHISASLAAPHFAPLALEFDAAVDRFDADRYLPPAPAKREATRFDPAWLDRLDLRGTLQIDELRAARAKMRNVRLAIRKPIDGKFEITAPARAKQR